MLTFPKILRIEPSSQCNLACSHCPTGTIDMPREVMNELTFINVINNIELNKNYIKTIVLYHGGEPLLNKNFTQYVGQIRDISPNFNIKTVSNGMALTKELSRKILDSGLDEIEFSLDGESIDESRYVRVKSRPELTIGNVLYLIELKKQLKLSRPRISISTVQFMRTNEITKISEAAKAPKWLLEIFREDVEYKPTYAVKWPHMGDSGKFIEHKIEESEIHHCDHVINTMTVRADGSVVACCYDLTSKLVMGNINNQLLHDIWNNKNYEELRESISTGKFKSICSTCSTVKPTTYLIPKWKQSELSATSI